MTKKSKNFKKENASSKSKRKFKSGSAKTCFAKDVQAKVTKAGTKRSVKCALESSQLRASSSAHSVELIQ